MNAQYLLRQFKNAANYLRLLFDPDLYSLCKSYPVISFAISSRNLITERIFTKQRIGTVYKNIISNLSISISVQRNICKKGKNIYGSIDP